MNEFLTIENAWTIDEIEHTMDGLEQRIRDKYNSILGPLDDDDFTIHTDYVVQYGSQGLSDSMKMRVTEVSLDLPYGLIFITDGDTGQYDDLSTYPLEFQFELLKHLCSIKQID